ncbi:MAG: RDD family protein [Victivallaceae bacterium]
MTMLKQSCRVHTPEGIDLSFYPASLVRRAVAVIIDSGMVMGLSAAVGDIGVLFTFFGVGATYAFKILAGLVIGSLYWIVLEWRWSGQTVGKKLMGIRVKDVDGLNLLFHQVVVRNLVRAADFLPLFYFAGALAAWLDPRSRRLGDLAAGTMVVVSSALPLPEYDDPENGGKYNSLRERPVEAARLRDAVTPEESHLLAEALRRRNELSLAARCELYGELATYFKTKVCFPDLLLADMSDENFLRNIANILYRD